MSKQIVLPLKCNFINLKASASASVHTLEPTAHSLNQDRQKMQPCRRADYAKLANEHVRRQTYMVFFIQMLYM